MRTLLSDSKLNTASANPGTDRIGVMPNLQAIITRPWYSRIYYRPGRAYSSASTAAAPWGFGPYIPICFGGPAFATGGRRNSPRRGNGAAC
jgi:hypothetical protein